MSTNFLYYQPPPLPLGNHKFVFVISWLYFCFAHRFTWTIFLDSTYKQFHIFFSVWLTSLSMAHSRFICVAAYGVILFFPWLINTHTHTYIYNVNIYNIGVTKSQTWLRDWTGLNWTELNWYIIYNMYLCIHIYIYIYCISLSIPLLMDI